MLSYVYRRSFIYIFLYFPPLQGNGLCHCGSNFNVDSVADLADESLCVPCDGTIGVCSEPGGVAVVGNLVSGTTL